jgi:hypothetical protein
MQVFEKLLVQVSSALERNRIPYMVIGGQAVLLHGKPRFTGDIDVTLGVDTDQLENVLAIFDELSLKPVRQNAREFAKRNALLSVKDTGSGIIIDLIFSFLPYERQAIDRAVEINIGGRRINFASAEDTIIHKLFAGRAVDLEDVKGIINLQENLDTKYIQKWLREFSQVCGRDLVALYNALHAEIDRPRKSS